MTSIVLLSYPPTQAGCSESSSRRPDLSSAKTSTSVGSAWHPPLSDLFETDTLTGMLIDATDTDHDADLNRSYDRQPCYAVLAHFCCVLR